MTEKYDLPELVRFRVVADEEGLKWGQGEVWFVLYDPNGHQVGRWAEHTLAAAWSHAPNFKASMDAVLEFVYPVLVEKGLWKKFREQWRYEQRGRHVGSWGHQMEWSFLNDLPGQYEAAVEVLKADRDNNERLQQETKEDAEQIDTKGDNNGFTIR